MFRRVLVANRGEIAVRVIRACRELGLATVAIYGEGEEWAKHVRLADDAYRIPAGPGLPYLDIEAIVAIARRAGAEAVHPGYGFLAENATFAEAVETAGMVFVGPPAAAIRAMGDKVEARRIAVAAGVPVVPGTTDPVDSVDAAAAWAAEHGYPIAVKAAGGGGGRGFRVARKPDELAAAFEGSSGEAARFFRNPTVYLERYLEQPRHIEVQIFADTHGQTVSLGERDCSVQRRHQKLIEETPSPAVDPELRRALGEAAVRLARAVEYRGAGTVEFLLDRSGDFAFLEMNTRIQVEHTVTEMVTGIDLVQEQLRVAAGEPLSFTDTDSMARGHAMECRINAEDPGRDFAPGPGLLTAYSEPGGPGIRIDGALEAGAAIQPAYDSLIAKLIAWGRTRTETIARMERALAEFRVEGVPTTIPFHRAVLAHPSFRAGDATTTFLTEHPEIQTGLAPFAPDTTAGTGLGVSEPVSREVLVEVNGRRLAVRITGELGSSIPATSANGRRPSRRTEGSQSTSRAAGPELISPIQGTVLRLLVASGQAVKQGDVVAVVEAMKMENEIAAHREGTVRDLRVQPGDAVKIGAVLATIDA